MPKHSPNVPPEAVEGAFMPANSGRARRFGLAVACVGVIVGAGQAWLGSSHFLAQGLTSRLEDAAGAWPDAAELAEISSKVDHYHPASQHGDAKAATWTIGHRVVLRGSGNAEQAFDVVGIAPLAPNMLPGTGALSSDLVVVTLKPVALPDGPGAANAQVMRVIVGASDAAAPGALGGTRLGNRSL